MTFFLWHECNVYKYDPDVSRLPHPVRHARKRCNEHGETTYTQFSGYKSHSGCPQQTMDADVVL